MPSNPQSRPRGVVRFGPFEYCSAEWTLTKHGIPLKVQKQSFLILGLLLESPGSLVERERIRRVLWPDGIYVDHERGINRAVSRLRSVLGDEAEEPKYVETVAAVGYRFIAPVEELADAVSPPVAEPEAGDIEHSPQLSRSRQAARFLPWMAAAGVLSAAGLAIWNVGTVSSQNSSRACTVIVAQIENATGDRSLGDVAYRALESEVAGSGAASTLPRPRIDDQLGWMLRQMDTPVTAEIAREIALREGGVAGIITARLGRRRDGLVLQLSLLNPVNSETLFADSETFQDASSVEDAVHRAVLAMHPSLSALQRTHPPQAALSRVSTRSLPALEAYTRAQQLVGQREWEAGLRLYGDAIREDPEFASAYMRRARVSGGKGMPVPEDLEQARRLAERLKIKERFLVLGEYELVKGNYEEAFAFLKSHLGLHPSDLMARHLLVDGYHGVGRASDAAAELVELARLNPDDAEANAGAAKALALWSLNPNAAEEYVRRAREGFRRRPRPSMSDAGLWVLVFDVYQVWLADDAHTTLSRIRSLEQEWTKDAEAAMKEGRRSEVPVQTGAPWMLLGHMYLSIGRVEDARRVFQHLGSQEPMTLHSSLAACAFALHDSAALQVEIDAYRKALGRGPNEMGMIPAIYFLRDLRPEEPEAFAEGVSRGLQPQGDEMAAESLLSGGQTATALPALEKSFEVLNRGRDFWGIVAADALAEAYERTRQPSKAVTVLLQASQARASVRLDFPGLGLIWIRSQARLERLLRESGRVAEARAVRMRLSNLLALADADLPEFKALSPAATRSTPLPSGL